MILGAKCHMIRDMQILEKRLITKELEEEEKRLAKMMEVERTKANEMQEALERRRKQEMIRFARRASVTHRGACPDVCASVSAPGSALEPEGSLLLSSRRGRQEIVKQIEKNAEERALRAEQQDQEVQEMLKYLERLKMEDLKVRPATWGGWSQVFTLLEGSPCAG